jgi:Short-chain alcohol dehydrogenase of unknown specificity
VRGSHAEYTAMSISSVGTSGQLFSGICNAACSPESYAPGGARYAHSHARHLERALLPLTRSHMTRPLDGTVALVTGASSGIGAATARALAAQGASVALAARRADRLEQLSSEIESSGGRTLVLDTDVADAAQAEGAVERTVRELGRLDTVINNAGVMLLGPIENAPLEEWERMVKVNALGVLYVAHAALRHLLDAAQSGPRRVADLVNVSSVAGRVARRNSGIYNLTKFGIGAFSESLRQEVTGRHVRVSLVEPGAVDTELMSHVRVEVREQAAQRFANVERLQADDIADAITFIVTRPRRMAINELLVRPTEQEQ